MAKPLCVLALLLASAGALLAPASTRRVSTVRFAGDALKDCLKK